MAIEMLKGPQQSADAGIFNLPPSFDTKQWAAEWVESSQVAMKEQRQVLQQVGATADGWTIWRNEANSEPTVVSGSGNKKFFLMCRPRAIQDEVNALYGDVTKKLLNKTVQGQLIGTEAGVTSQEQGMVSEDRISGGKMSEQVRESLMPLNREKVFDETAAAT